MNLYTFAMALGWPEHETLERLRELELAERCARCDGKGHVGLEQKPESRCFRCAGSGDQLPKLTRALSVEAATRVIAGGLRNFFARKKRQADAARELPGLVAQCRRDLGSAEARYELEDVVARVSRRELDPETGTVLLRALYSRVTSHAPAGPP